MIALRNTGEPYMNRLYFRLVCVYGENPRVCDYRHGSTVTSHSRSPSENDVNNSTAANNSATDKPTKETKAREIASLILN